MRVLWVDDDRLFISPFVDDLEDHGVSVTRVFRIDEAYETILESHLDFDAIIIDIMMRVRDGFNVPKAAAGTRTGIVLLERVLGTNERLKSKLMVVTVVNEPDVLSFAEGFGIKVLPKQTATSEEIISHIRVLAK